MRNRHAEGSPAQGRSAARDGKPHMFDVPEWVVANRRPIGRASAKNSRPPARGLPPAQR